MKAWAILVTPNNKRKKPYWGTEELHMGTMITYRPKSPHKGTRAIVGGWSGPRVPMFFRTRTDALEFFNNYYAEDLEDDEATGKVIKVELPKAAREGGGDET